MCVYVHQNKSIVLLKPLNEPNNSILKKMSTKKNQKPYNLCVLFRLKI